jgi:deoxyribonuclease V
MRINYIHSFDVSVDEAKRIQKELANKVVLEPGPPPEKVKHIAGVDVSYEKSNDTAYAVVVVLEFPSLELKEIRFSSKKSPFPYIPGFLSFRELPPLLEAMSQLTIVPDIVFCDSQGIAHPRFIGLASHLGLFIELPTIGVAKKLLCGEYSSLDTKKHSYSEIIYRHRIVGYAYRSRDSVKPIFISPGHKTTLSDTIMWAKILSIKYRILYPIRIAHIQSNIIRKKLK